MARWTVGEGDEQIVVEVEGSVITLSVPAVNWSVSYDSTSAGALRGTLGYAIAVATGGQTGGQPS
jgi:hypothetical protein